jgi:hypothetical protein
VVRQCRKIATQKCADTQKNNLSALGISEITTAIWDDRGQIMMKLGSNGNNKFHERGGILFMTNSWFAPPKGWTHIGLG